MQEYKIRPRERALEHLDAYLAERRLAPGDRLPAERELCDLWGLNRCTLRSAVSRLERDGVLTARRGAGVFAAPPKFHRNLQDLKSFTEEARLQGRRAETRLLCLDTVDCDKQFSRRFQLMLGTPLWKLARLRCVDGAPVLVETSFFPAARFPEIDRYNFEKRSLYAVFEEEYQASPARGEEKISITRANAEEAELLGLTEGAPVFWLVTQTYDAAGQLLEYCRTVARGDRLVLTSVLERREAT